MTTPTVKAPEAKAMPSGAKRKNDEQAEPKKVCKTAEGDEAMQKEKLKQELRERHKIALQTKETARLKTLKTASWNVLDNTGPAPSSPITPPLPKQPPLTKQDTKEAEDLAKAVRIQERKDWWMSTISEDQRLSRASRRLPDVFMKAATVGVVLSSGVVQGLGQFWPRPVRPWKLLSVLGIGMLGLSVLGGRALSAGRRPAVQQHTIIAEARFFGWK